MSRQAYDLIGHLRREGWIETHSGDLHTTLNHLNGLSGVERAKKFEELFGVPQYEVGSFAHTQWGQRVWSFKVYQPAPENFEGFASTSDLKIVLMLDTSGKRVMTMEVARGQVPHRNPSVDALKSTVERNGVTGSAKRAADQIAAIEAREQRRVEAENRANEIEASRLHKQSFVDRINEMAPGLRVKASGNPDDLDLLVDAEVLLGFVQTVWTEMPWIIDEMATGKTEEQREASS